MKKCQVCGRKIIRGHKVGIVDIEWLCLFCKFWACKTLDVPFWDAKDPYWNPKDPNIRERNNGYNNQRRCYYSKY
jgi:hypothetical protein